MEKEFSGSWELLEYNKLTLVKLTTDLQFANFPELEIKYGRSGKERCAQDNEFHFRYLVEAVRFNNPDIFCKYLCWASVVLQSRNIPSVHLKKNLLFMDSACQAVSPGSTYNIISGFINAGIGALDNVPPPVEGYLLTSKPLQTEARQYLSLLLKADRHGARKIIDRVLMEGCAIADVYEFIFQNTQYEIGLLWEMNKISVAHEHYCTAATQSIIAGLYGQIFTSQNKSRKMIACAVGGELHEIGIRMLADLFEMDGWNAYYLGANMPDDNLIAALIEQEADLLAISVTMPFNVGKAETLISKIRGLSQLKQLKIVVGGYAFNTIENLWRQVGADGHALNARQAIALGSALL